MNSKKSEARIKTLGQKHSAFVQNPRRTKALIKGRTRSVKGKRKRGGMRERIPKALAKSS